MSFDTFCTDNQVTDRERELLAHHLAGIRYRETLKLAHHPIKRAALAAVKSEQPWPPMGFIPVERCEHGTPKGYLCQVCHA